MKQLISAIAISVAASTMAVGRKLRDTRGRTMPRRTHSSSQMKSTRTSKPEKHRRAACPGSSTSNTRAR